MLKFWKNAGKGRVQAKSPESSSEPVSPARSVSSCGNHIEDFFSRFEIENVDDSDSDDVLKESSRLSKKLPDILSEEHSLSYFMKFMESLSALHLVEFWRDVERFKDSVRLLQTHGEVSPMKHQAIGRTVSFDSSLPSKNERSLPRDVKNVHFNNLDGKKFPSCHVDVNKSDHPNGLDETADLRNRILNDAISIFKRYIALESPCKLDIPEDVRNSIISSICHPKGVIDPDIFKRAQDDVLEQMDARYYSRFVQSDHHCKYQLDILTGKSLTIEDVIYNEVAFVYFMEYLEQEQCNALLEFVMAVMNFKEQLIVNKDIDSEQAQNDAIVLYDKYFSLQATNSLGFSSDIRFLMEQNICQDGGPSPDCFHKPFRLVLGVLKQYISTFVTSQLYYKYLSDIIGSIQVNWHGSKRHRGSTSDCSSEVSHSTRNTNAGEHSSMRIDLKQLYNGDLLWRRKSDKGLSLGRVNSLGRFESTMEPDPERKGDSIIKRVVNKFVNGEKDKAEEELAWQVAHMIVKDVTDVTMGIPEGQL